MNEDIKKIIKNTTITKIEENKKQKVIFGSEYDVSRFVSNQGDQVDLKDYEMYWNKKWKSFGNTWSEERQIYRLFYDDFKLFYYSFSQLRINKVTSLNSYNKKEKTGIHNQYCAVNLYNMYNHGKKCNDIFKKLNLCKILNDQELSFALKFSETRNKFLSHNFNPNGYSYKFEPDIWSLRSSDSFLTIYFHGKAEREFDAYVDYYEDYYQLEKILTKIIKKYNICQK